MLNKKKTAVKAATMLLAFTTVLAACGGNNNASTGSATNAPADNNAAADPSDTSKAVTLKMVLIGPRPADYDMVFGQLNTLLQEKINATVETQFLDWSDWTQKYPLMFAANEDFDLVYSANWAFYNDQSLKGGFLELTEDMLQTYTPQTWEAMAPAAWEQAKVGGKLFMVPNNNEEVTDKVVLYRHDLLEKYNLEPIDSPETYAAYLKAVAANEPGVSAYGAKPADGWKWHELDQALLEQANEWNLVDANSMPLAYRLDDATGQVFNVYDTPEFGELLKYYKDLADNGAWSRNIVSNKNDIWQEIKAGKISSYAHTLGTLGANVAEMRREKPEYDVAIADLTPEQKKIGALSTQNGMAVHSTSKNPERALMLIDLLQNDKEIHDLTMYGIAGTHYNPVGDDRFTAGPSQTNYNNFSNWGWNSLLNRTDDSYPVEADDMLKAWQEKVYNFPLESFVFDDTSVKNEVANVGNVMLRYAIPLEYGLIDDLEKGQADLISQLKSAGIDKLQAELQSQVDAFLAANAQ
jgi:putative aldouronate transport system substrate-binding protein